MAGPLMEYTPHTPHTAKLLYSLADLNQKRLRRHGSSFYGDCGQTLIDLNFIMKEIWGNDDK